ncbi:MAG: polar amino acid transport system substrate-binding protein [Frankiaceae bacterium]|nr:polar amino acid transport system substrate-binding protein [Frankiaceae bacterium]MDQ1723464.1 polar amino acid transport system substrate-binding protein [Frankiaceae bacterium]
MYRNLPFRRSLVAACAASLVAIAGCSSSSSTTAAASPTPSTTGSAPADTATASPAAATGGKPLVIGTSGDFPPLSYKGSTGAIVGFEDDMMKAIGASMGRSVTWQQFDFSGLIPALQSGRIDAVVSGLYDTAARANVVDIIDYMQIPLGVMTLKDNAAKTKSATDLCGKSVAYILGSPPELAQIQQWSDACKAAGNAAVTATGYKSVAAAVADIVNGRTYAELEGDITVLYVSQTQYGDKLGVGFNVEGQTSKVGIAVAKGSQLATDLKPAVAAWMASPAYCTDVTQWKLSAGDLLQPCP